MFQLSSSLSSVALRRSVSLKATFLALTTLFWVPSLAPAEAQTSGAGQPLRLEADIQEANAKTGVVTARGNVRITYPARQIQATSAQAQYFSRENLIVLSGNVYVLQQGNSLRGEVITYLVNEGRFVAKPAASKQVEAVYLVQDSPIPSPAAPGATTPSPLETKPEFAPVVEPSPATKP